MSWAAATPILVTMIAAVLAGGFLYRHGGGTALSELERANSVLEKRIQSLEAENNTLHAEVAELRARTDIVEAMKPLADALTQHDHGVAQRDKEMITLLSKIAGILEARRATDT